MRTMAEGLLKELLQTKLKMMDGVIQILPPQIRDQIIEIQQSILQVVHDVTKEYAVAQPPVEQEKGLAAIKIE